VAHIPSQPGGAEHAFTMQAFQSGNTDRAAPAIVRLRPDSGVCLHAECISGPEPPDMEPANGEGQSSKATQQPLNTKNAHSLTSLETESLVHQNHP
jgi:hypothetical protein